MTTEDSPTPLLITAGKKVRMEEPVRTIPKGTEEYFEGYEEVEDQDLPRQPPEEDLPKKYPMKYSNERERLQELLRVKREKELDRKLLIERKK